MTGTAMPLAAEPPAYLRPDALAERWATTTKTLANWRSLGKGPAFVKIGGAVRYPLTDVLAYENANYVPPVSA